MAVAGTTGVIDTIGRLTIGRVAHITGPTKRDTTWKSTTAGIPEGTRHPMTTTAGDTIKKDRGTTGAAKGIGPSGHTLKRANGTPIGPSSLDDGPMTRFYFGHLRYHGL